MGHCPLWFWHHIPFNLMRLFTDRPWLHTEAGKDFSEIASDAIDTLMDEGAELGYSPREMAFIISAEIHMKQSEIALTAQVQVAKQAREERRQAMLEIGRAKLEEEHQLDKQDTGPHSNKGSSE